MNRFLLFSLLIFSSCLFGEPTPATDEQKADVFKSAIFDSIIIMNIPKYEKLKNFIEAHSDTIIAYRNSKNVVTEISGNGTPDSTHLEKADCYTFFEGNDKYDITNVPDHLKKELNEIYFSIGDSSINSFTVCLNKTVTIQVKENNFYRGLSLCHEILWNLKLTDNSAYIKKVDTVLPGNCIYRIGLKENLGW